MPVVSRSASGTVAATRSARAPLLAAPLVANLHRKRPPFGMDHRAVAQQLRHRLRRQRRAHHHDPQIGPQRLPDSRQHAEHQIHLECAP